MSLPTDSADDATKNPSAIRLGVQELTRFGMKEKEMKVIAELFRKALMENSNIKKDVIDFRKQFQKVKYCFEA
jgi:glycine hydroxymethyltransferase